MPSLFWKYLRKWGDMLYQWFRSKVLLCSRIYWLNLSFIKLDKINIVTIKLGSFCETSLEVSVCFPNACNGGECIPNADNRDFTCKCDAGYFGRYCETQSCNPNPCQNEQQCVISLKGPQCLCINAYTGNFCESIV